MRPAPSLASPLGPVIIAHRGGSLEVPENTVAAVRHAVAAGADWQEIDVTLSADERVVVIHDDTLERTTSGQGRVDERTADELTKLSAGNPTWTEAARQRLGLFGVEPPDFGERFQDSTVPLLADVLTVEGARLMIEIKKVPPGRVRDLAHAVIEEVQRAQAMDRVILGSFETDILWAVHDRDPTLPLIAIAETDAAIEAALQLPIQALAVRLDHVGSAAERAPGHIAIWAWTLYTVAMADAAVEQGAHGLITDVPAALVTALRTPPPTRIELP